VPDCSSLIVSEETGDYIIEYNKRNILKHSVDEDSGVDNKGRYWIVV
jgi:hypothetical protein